MSVFPTPDPNRLHIFPTRPPPPAQPARPPLPHNLAHPHKQYIFTQLPAARFPHFNSRPWSQLRPFSSRWFCVSVVLVAHSQVENNTISYFGRMLRQVLLHLFLFFFFFRGFIKPYSSNVKKDVTTDTRQMVAPRHDVNAPGAVVMPRPSATHQVTIEHRD